MNQRTSLDEQRIGEHETEPEAQILITRIIDGEADAADHVRFDALAAAEPTLWRQLALRQRDMTLLAEYVRDVTAKAAAMDLPRRWIVPARLTWPLLLSGWAAMIILSLSWSLNALINRADVPQDITMQPVRMTPEEHYASYREAPYVIGEMQPLVVEVEALSDGRVAVHFVRRIEEVAFLDPTKELPLDEDGGLTRDPATLRSFEPHVGLWP